MPHINQFEVPGICLQFGESGKVSLRSACVELHLESHPSILRAWLCQAILLVGGRSDAMRVSRLTRAHRGKRAAIMISTQENDGFDSGRPEHLRKDERKD